MNIEATIRYLDSERGKLHLFDVVKHINRFIRTIKEIPNLEVYTANNDVTKILIKVTNMSGFELSDILFEKYGIEDELANEKSVLLLSLSLLEPCESSHHHFRRAASRVVDSQAQINIFGQEIVKKLFATEHYKRLIIERKDGALLYKALLNTDVEYSSARLDEIMKSHDFILSLERCDDE
jgi:hypothetical protein